MAEARNAWPGNEQQWRRACSIVSHVSTPKTTGTPVSMPAPNIPLVAAPATLRQPVASGASGREQEARTAAEEQMNSWRPVMRASYAADQSGRAAVGRVQLRAARGLY